MDQVKSAAEWAREMARLNSIKPRPVDKWLGKNATPEQVAKHTETIKAWNKAYRHASKEQKAALIRDNKRFREQQANA